MGLKLICNLKNISDNSVKSLVESFCKSIKPTDDKASGYALTKCYNISLNFVNLNKSAFYCEGFVNGWMSHAWVQINYFPIDLKAIWFNEIGNKFDNKSYQLIGTSEVDLNKETLTIPGTSNDFDVMFNYYQKLGSVPEGGFISLTKRHKINLSTFAISNYILKKYLIKLLNYPQVDSKSYHKVRNKLKGHDDFVLSLIGGTPEYQESRGHERQNYLTKLIDKVRLKGEDTVKNVSFAARNLYYESKIDTDMNKRELFTELRNVCSKSNNPRAKRAFNELVKAFDCGGACPGGASVSEAGVGDGGVDIKGKPLDQDEIDNAVKEASRSTFNEGDIKTEEQFRSWLNNYYKNVHKDDFDQEIADKVANDLINKYKDDFGAMIGAAKSFSYVK